jgi:hypothetical protein
MKFITVTPVSEGGFTAMIEGRPNTTVGGNTEKEAIAELLIKHGEDYFQIQILRKKE